MKIGFLTRFEKDKIDFAQSGGFGSIELLVGPDFPLDPVKSSDDDLKRAKDYMDERGLEISAIGAYTINCLSADRDIQSSSVECFMALMRMSRKMGVDVVAGYPGCDLEKSPADNIPAYKRVFGPIAEVAEDLGIKIAFENCPKFHYFPFRGINFAYTAATWDLMFDALRSENLGIEYDPSHPISMLADPLAPLKKYGSRIFHVHAKDAEILHDNLRMNGIFQPGLFRYRMPGFGDVDWRRFVSALLEAGYSGNLDIEGSHDIVFANGREQEGLLFAKQYLSQFVVAGRA